MLGRHFLVRSLSNKKVSRQYTVCNVLQTEIYEELIRLLRTDETNLTWLSKLLDKKDTNNIMFTIKNYNSKNGLSAKFFDK